MPPSPSPSDDRLQRLVAQCIERWEAEGPAALDALCAGHPELASALRQRVEALRALGLLDAAADAAMPERIGGYRLLRVLGEGGMGVVFEAEQEQPRRRVALKVLRTGLLGTAVKARFAHEAHWLARLQHAGIAQIHEAGSATVGGDVLPFFAMELVDGPTLIEFARARGLDARGRLELLAKVCDAVQHAHQKGVIHRDLKPSNILVDASGQPKVLDFGVARATDPELAATLYTRRGQLVGTLAYMSPEQAAADPDAVDTRTDVYALGVIAHELLAGALPYDVDGLRLADALRVIQEQPPRKLGDVDRALRGDVETIVLTALAKEKEARYASVAAFAADIRRFSAFLPIAARAPSTWYTLRRFARRHRALVVGAAAVALALALGLAGTAIGLLDARRERAAAERRFRQAEAAFEFQRRMLASAQPFTEGRDVRVADVLDRAALEMEGAYPDQPEVEASLRQALGETYHALGLEDKAEPQLTRAVELVRAALGDGAPETCSAVAVLAGFLVDVAQPERAEALLRRALAAAAAAPEANDGGSARDARLRLRAAEARRLRLVGELEDAAALQRALLAELRAAGDADEELRFAVIAALATTERLRGQTAAAVDLTRDLLERISARFGPRHPRTLKAMSDLATALQSAGQIEASRKLADQVLEVAVDVLGPAQPDALTAMCNAGYNALALRDLERAEELFRQVLAAGEGRFGPTSPLMLTAKNNLAAALNEQGEIAEAEAILRPLIAALRAEQGEEHPNTLTAQNSLAVLLQRAKRFDEAMVLQQQVLDARRRALGDEHYATLRTLHNLGVLYSAVGRGADAERLLREAVDTARRALSTEDFLTGEFLCALGRCLSDMERYDEAEPLLLEGHAWLARTLGADKAPTRQAATAVRTLYERQGKAEQAAEWSARGASG